MTTSGPAPAGTEGAQGTEGTGGAAPSGPAMPCTRDEAGAALAAGPPRWAGWRRSLPFVAGYVVLGTVIRLVLGHGTDEVAGTLLGGSAAAAAILGAGYLWDRSRVRALRGVTDVVPATVVEAARRGGGTDLRVRLDDGTLAWWPAAARPGTFTVGGGVWCTPVREDRAVRVVVAGQGGTRVVEPLGRAHCTADPARHDHPWEAS